MVWINVGKFHILNYRYQKVHGKFMMETSLVWKKFKFKFQMMFLGTYGLGLTSY